MDEFLHRQILNATVNNLSEDKQTAETVIKIVDDTKYRLEVKAYRAALGRLKEEDRAFTYKEIMEIVTEEKLKLAL